ncbi:hypothetical protein T11_1450 [Trichinella zimbabwensis]|uniref:Uncharacterized protein n=1 Tax=Trichinella zimbabwensis TaxID=268475 RepID=A0A0V1HPK7_9BILA|nr:hypothetical protein T11_1450 [Trichinella zimbabwensis]
MASEVRIDMLMHTVADSFLKISREIRNQERRGYSHSTSQIVPNRLISIMFIFGEKSFSRKFRNFVSYRPACFVKNGEKSFTGNSPVVVG